MAYVQVCKFSLTVSKGATVTYCSLLSLVFSGRKELEFSPFLQRIGHPSGLKLEIGISQNSSLLSKSVFIYPFF